MFTPYVPPAFPTKHVLLVGHEFSQGRLLGALCLVLNACVEHVALVACL